MSEQPKPPAKPKRSAGRPWQKGQSGNPGGRLKMDPEVRAAAREYTMPAIRRLAIELDKGDTSSARILAANSLLDRGWGKPTQPIAGDAENPPPLTAEERQRRLEGNRRAALQAIDAAFTVVSERKLAREQEERERLLALPSQGMG